LKSDKNYKLAKKQMRGGGTTIGFKIKGDKTKAFAVMNQLQVIDISNNLGDSKSLITHPASTTHRRVGAEVQLQMGITPNLVRLSVGLENVDDLIADLKQALGK
jgi:O-succinylhomoserine sulfhydrylase